MAQCPVFDFRCTHKCCKSYLWLSTISSYDREFQTAYVNSLERTHHPKTGLQFWLLNEFEMKLHLGVLKSMGGWEGRLEDRARQRRASRRDVAAIIAKASSLEAVYIEGSIRFSPLRWISHSFVLTDQSFCDILSLPSHPSSGYYSECSILLIADFLSLSMHLCDRNICIEVAEGSI